MSKKENIAFLNNHKPLLKAGEYTIKAQQHVKLKGETADALSDSHSKTIYVAAERFSITQNDIIHMYPPPGKKGNYHNVVPHICLKGSTFPWERSSGINHKDIPWLWLFVYDEDDVTNGNVVPPANYPLNTVFQQPADKSNITPYKNGLPLTAATEQKITIVAEPGETDSSNDLLTTPVSCVQIKLDWLEGTSSAIPTNAIMPSTEDLPMMAAVRQNENPDDPADIVEHAICLANRMPKAGKKTYACLLSLEDRLAPTSYNAGADKTAYTTTGIENGYTTFVCLTHWEFDCLSDQYYEINTRTLAKIKSISGLPADIQQAVAAMPHDQLFRNQEDLVTALDAKCGSLAEWATYKSQVIEGLAVPDETFAGFMTNLSSQAFQFDPLPDSADPSTPILNEYLSSGAAAFTHRLNTGEKTLSWYHGPFRPSDAQPTEESMTGILSSDPLLRFDDQLNMLDVSYAAAWELGRMLTLKNKTVAMDLYAWRRQQAWAKHNSSSRYAKVLQPPMGTSIESKEQTAIADWCLKLANLTDLPYNYLVPDERLLPKESIRFFTIDQYWVSALLDGALSIGRTSTTTQEEEQATIAAFNTPASRAISGFLLHSEAVSGWPHLLTEAKQFKLVNEDGLEDPQNITCNLLLEKRLSTNIVLFLYEGLANEHDIHLKPEALHFGLDVPAEGSESNYFKNVRFSFTDYTAPGAGAASTHELTATKNDPGKVPTIPFNNPTEKVLDINTLSGDIKNIAYGTTALEAPYSSAEFVMEMVEPQAHINFTQEDTQTMTATLTGESDINATFVSGSGIFGKKGTIPPPDPGNGDINFLAGAGSGGTGTGEEQDEELMAVIKKVLAGGAAVIEKIVEEAHNNGLTVPTQEGSVTPSAQQKFIEQIVAQIVEKGGMTLLESILEDVFKKQTLPPPKVQDSKKGQDSSDTGPGQTDDQDDQKNSGAGQDGADNTHDQDKSTTQHDGPDNHDDQDKSGTDKDQSANQERQEPIVQTIGVTHVDKLLEGVLAKLNEVKAALNADEEKVKARVEGTAEKLKDGVEKAVTDVKDEEEHVVDGVKDKVHEVVTDIESVPEKVKALLTKVKTEVALSEAGVKIMADIIVAKIKDKVHDDVDAVKDKASELAEGILGHIHQAESDFAEKAKTAIGDVKAGIADGVEKVIDDVKLVESKAESLKAEVANHVKNIEGDVVNAAKNTLAKVEGKVRSKVAELKAEEHLAKQKEAQLLDDITSRIHEVKHGIAQKISEIKDDVAEDKANLLHDAHALVEEVEAKVKAIKTNLKSEVVEKFKDLEKAALGFFKSPFDAVKKDVEEVKSKVHDDAENVKADIEKDIQWLKARKTLVWIVLGLLVISIGTWVYRTAFVSEPPTPLLSHFEGVKQLDEIEFVKQHYEEAVPVTDKDGQLEFLLSVPATVSGKMDMTQLKYELGKDSLLKVTLPPVLLSDVNVDLQNVTSYDDRGKSMKLFLSGGGKAYGKAYAFIIEAVEQVKKGVLSNAIKNDLMDETRQSARIYLLHIANSIGYRVEFIETKPSASFEKDIEDRVGKKLWEQLKHKVQKVDPVDKPASQTAGTESKREERRDARDDKKEDK